MDTDGATEPAKETKASAETVDMDEEDERICRYCFEGEEEGDLISPCKCAGGQKYVHLKCLRQWQRMVLVSQPTHPAFYDRDLRHQTCNVCKSEFTCAPPTRHELMASFTGPEVAALIDPGCVIAAHEAFSSELESQLARMPAFMHQQSSYLNWIKGVYLITAVEEEHGSFTLPIDSQSMLVKVREKMGSELSMQLQGRRLRLASSHDLKGVASERLAEAFEKLRAPCTIHLEAVDPTTCGDDHVVAVNLTRPFEPDQALYAKIVEKVTRKYKSAAAVKITHFMGGPCEEEDIMSCIVLGGSGCGWTVVKDLEAAVELAYTRAVKRFDTQGEIAGGQTVRLVGLQAAPELNDEIGIALRFVESSGRWLIRLRNGDGKQLRPANLEGLEGAGGRVFCFWGDARWSRAQLLGEIAKGDWGLCRANVGDLAAKHTERWSNMGSRPAFAPITDMSEGYMREATRQMNAARATHQMHGAEADTEDQDE